MVIKDIIRKLEKWCPTEHPCKSDIMVYGDINSEVNKVCVCCIATCDIIKKAKEWGADLLITHEPTYHVYCPDGENDIVNQKKTELIKESGVNILRIHDRVHFTSSDKIIEGVLQKLGWNGLFDGNKKFTFAHPKTVAEIKNDIETNLALKKVRLTGNTTQTIKNISMCVGAWGPDTVLAEISNKEIDGVICGEIPEWMVCEYVRDAAQLGFKKSLFLLGHMGSERSGMEYVYKYLSDNIPELEFNYLDCEEVY